jgi:hypothetical protein
METIKKNDINQPVKPDLYKKIINEIVSLDSSKEQQIKDDFFSKVKSSLQGKDLIIENNLRR